MRMVQEECGELVAAVNRFDRGRPGSREGLIEEIADAHIVLAQARVAFGETEVDEAIRRKLLRLEQRLTAGEGLGARG
jgi:NTP pyrophosphatase (non-canonical NTP hydrolase)